VLGRVDHRQRLLVPREVGRNLARCVLPAPDSEQVVVELERDPERPAEVPVALDHRVVVGRQERPGLDRCRDEGSGLAADHVEVAIDRQDLVVLGCPDVDVLALAQAQAGLVVQAHQAKHLRVRKAEVGQPVERDSGQREQHVAGVDRLRDALALPQGLAVPTLDVAVLDVVVDEAEVVAELDGRGAGQRALVLARDRRVGEQAEEGAHALAGRTTRSVEAEVVANHLVHAAGRRVAVAHQPEDLVLRVGDELGQVELGGHGRHPEAV
jgi:hypothetical protein